MLKLIIWISGRPNLNGFKRREFVWSEPHGCYLYMGREFAPSEFNEAFEKAFKNNRDFYPRAKVIETDEAPANAPAASTPISTKPEPLTLEIAEAFIMANAPERLKKKTGPKPAENIPDVG